MDPGNHQHFHTQFPTIVDDYLANLLLAQPHIALKAGLHSGDGHVADWSAGSLAVRCEYLREMITKLAPIAKAPLLWHPPHDAIPNRLISANYLTWDARLCLIDAQTELYKFEVLRIQESNPLAYLPLVDITPYLKRLYWPIDQRLSVLLEHLRHIPEVFFTARQQIRPPIAIELLEQSISTYTALLQFHQRELRHFFSKSFSTELVMQLTQANMIVIEAYQRYIAFLADLHSNTPRTGAWKMASIAEWFNVSEHLQLTDDELLHIGNDDLANNQAILQTIVKKAGKTAMELIRELDSGPLSIDDILPNTRAIVNQLKAFIMQQKLVTIPSTGQYHIQETQTYMRNGSAFLDAPGPFEQGQIATAFFLTLPDVAWSDKQQQQWLLKQGKAGLTNTAIHEVWPGHFLQFSHLAFSPTRASKILTSTAFIEGWAHYAEELMILAGHNAQQPGYRVQQLLMAILRDCRLIASVLIHQGTMSTDEAADFIMRQTGFPAIRARQEALRCVRDYSYGGYLLGKLQIKQVREALLRNAPALSECAINDTILAFGAPPIPLLYEVLIGRPMPPLKA